MTTTTGFFPWTVDEARGTRRQDPINMYFVGALGELEAAGAAVRSHLQVNPTQLANDQWFLEYLSGAPSSHRHDLSLGGERDLFARASRVHIRLYAGSHNNSAVTVGAMHRDALSLCGDAAISFDVAREWAAERLRAKGFDVVHVRNKARGSVRQCDGNWTPTDGLALLVRE